MLVSRSASARSVLTLSAKTSVTSLLTWQCVVLVLCSLFKALCQWNSVLVMMSASARAVLVPRSPSSRRGCCAGSSLTARRLPAPSRRGSVARSERRRMRHHSLPTRTARLCLCSAAWIKHKMVCYCMPAWYYKSDSSSVCLFPFMPTLLKLTMVNYGTVIDQTLEKAPKQMFDEETWRGFNRREFCKMKYFCDNLN